MRSDTRYKYSSKQRYNYTPQQELVQVHVPVLVAFSGEIRGMLLTYVSNHHRRIVTVQYSTRNSSTVPGTVSYQPGTVPIVQVLVQVPVERGRAANRILEISPLLWRKR